MAAITPIKYAETSTGGVRNPMRDFVSNLPNIYNQYLTILDRNRQRELQDAQFAEGKRQFEEAQALRQQEFEAQNLQNLAANTLAQQQLRATIDANAATKQYQQDMLDFKRAQGSSSSSSSGGSGGYKRDPGLDKRIQDEIDYYYSLAKDIDSLSTYIAKLKNTSNDSEFNEWFAAMPEEKQGDFLRFSAISGKRLGEKIDYAKLADSLSKQLDNKHSQAQSVYANMTRYIDNINKSLGGPVYNKPVNLFPEKHPDAIRAEEEKRLAEQKKRNAEIMAKMKEAERLRWLIENTAYGSNDNNLSGSSQGKSGAPAKAEYDTSMWPILGTKPISLGVGDPIDPSYFNGGNNVHDTSMWPILGTKPISLGVGDPIDPSYLNSGNNVYEQYLRALNAGKIR
jgi:hypothetical protein